MSISSTVAPVVSPQASLAAAPPCPPRPPGSGAGVLTTVPRGSDEPADLLALVVDAAQEHLRATRCTILLTRPDGSLQRAACATAPGADLPRTRRAPLDRASLAREAIRTGRPARVADAPGELTLVHPRPVRPVLAVPLLVHDEVAGVLQVERGPGDDARPGDDDAAVRFAALAEVALARTARTGRRERALAAAEQARGLQARLTEAVLGGAEADDVITVLGDLLGRPVALLDAALRVRTWVAPPALHLAEPPSLPAIALDLPAVQAALAALGPERPSTVLAPHQPSGLTRRHLVAVLIAEGRVLGYLDVIEMGRALGPAETVLAEHAATVLSVQLLGEARALRAAARGRDEILADLLAGSRTPEDLRRLAGHAGVDLQRPHVLVRLPVDPARSPAACRDEIVSIATAALGEAPAALAEPDAVVLVVRMLPDPGAQPLRRLHRDLRGALDALAARTGVRRAVVSGVCRDVPDFPAAHAEAREVDAIVAALGGRTDVVPVTELSTLRLVVNGDRADVAMRFAEQCLGPLRRSDEATGGDLVETLRAYLESGAQVRATAKALGVHENTVRYRLGRVEHVTGLDVRRFDALLAVQLAFQVDGLGAAARGAR